jgi:hypothetical protein
VRATTRFSDVVFDRERAVADDGLTYLHLNHPLVKRVLGELTDGREPAVTALRLAPAALPMGLALPDGGGMWAVYRLRMTNYADVNRAELVSVFVDRAGRSYARAARSLLNLAPELAETSYLPAGADLRAMQDAAQRLAEAQAADRFSELQLEHAERLAAEREKLERYYRQQEAAVAGIAIENIRRAKQRELLDRRHADLHGLDQRLTAVPDLVALGLAVVE